jgi:hypothetical protein
MSAEIITRGDAAFDISGVLQAGFEPGCDDFSIVAENMKMPTTVVDVVQKQDGEAITSYWKGKLSWGTLRLITSAEISSATTEGVTWPYTLTLSDGQSYDPNTLVLNQFRFNTPFVLNDVSQMHLDNSRTEFGQTTRVTRSTLDVVLTPPRAALQSFRGSFGNLTVAQSGVLDVSPTNAGS